jgi:DNA-binding response OmpR family regulator
MSGYDNNVIAKRGIILQGIDYLQKPFSIGDLIGKVRSVLQQRTLSNQR